MIEKITNIKNMATFQDFNWDKTVLNANKQPETFKEINILYGRNYSGKTTLSRILRALETGNISSHYNHPEFTIAIKNGTPITQSNLATNTQTVRVFNDDFVRDNLRFIYDPNDNISSFAIGSKNTSVEAEIAQKEETLGNELANTGLLGDLNTKKSSYDTANKSFNDEKNALEKKLANKATKGGGNIKDHPLQFDINYNITKINKDIVVVTESSYVALTSTEKDNLTATVKQEQKTEISPSTPFTLQLDNLEAKAKTLVEQKITISNPIQDLLNDQLLEKWAKEGMALHKDKRTTCGFCGNPINSDLWDKLSKHFNQESEGLTTNISTLLSDIQTELDNSKNLFDITPNAFYAEFTASAQILKSKLDTEIQSYQSSLTSLSKQLKARLNSISTPLAFSTVSNNSTELTAVRDEYEVLRNQSNAYTTSLDANKKKAKTKLRLQEIYQFTQDIGYIVEQKKVSQLEADKNTKHAQFQTAQAAVTKLKAEIQSLRDQLSDEGFAAKQINEYLNHFFGHAHLSIEPIQEQAGYRFEVWRNKQKAFQLSEGECSLIAFCYFIAKLEDVTTKDSKPIIWIDDPISSLDSNHIFFIYSLISSKIIKSEKFQQLFVSTHNLDFLKYLKRLHDKKSDNKTSWQRNYLLIDRVGDSSQIRPMPNYLKKYATEFNYLFEQLYLCATAKVEETEIKHDCFYNYGNNARKFLNAYLFYHHPNPRMDEAEKLKKFLDDDIAYELLDRLHNEHSHLEEIPDRSMKPIDIPEMQKSAKLILSKIKQKNPDQFNGLCESIDVSPSDITNILA